jgi:hypothetical protein
MRAVKTMMSRALGTKMFGFEHRLRAGLIDLYVDVGLLAGGIAFVITFIAVYIIAIDFVAWLIGIALGWIPALLAGSIAAAVFGFLWPLLVVALIVLVYTVTR